MKEHGQSLTDKGPRLLKGIAILGAAAVISKLLGTLQKIPLQNIAGDEAYGIYSAVYPFYVLILFLATAGFPTAVSKMVSEQAASGNWIEARRIYRLSAVILIGTGIITFVMMYMGAGLIAGWIGSSQSEQALRSVSFALLLVPLMAALRGYYQGMQNMIPTAVSQVMEQTLRVAVMIFLILLLTESQASSGTVAAGATFGSAAGAAAGLLVMLVHDWRARSKIRRANRTGSEVARQIQTPGPTLLRRIVKHALPVALGSIAVPIISMIDSFTLPNLLAASQGLDEQEALQQFGVYARGLPLVQLVAMLFSSMSAALVPALSDARALGDNRRVQRQAELSVRLTMLIGFAASAGLATVSLPINVMLFTDANGTLTMAILAWTALFSSLNVVTAAILQGISKERLPALYLLIAALVKIVCNLLLIPYYGIAGAAWSGLLAYAVACVLNLHAVKRYAGVTWRLRQDFIRPLLAVAAMVAVIGALYGGFALLTSLTDLGISARLWYTVQALVMIVVGAAVFGLAALRTGALTEAELMLVPGLYRKIAPLLRKWRVLR